MPYCLRARTSHLINQISTCLTFYVYDKTTDDLFIVLISQDLCNSCDFIDLWNAESIFMDATDTDGFYLGCNYMAIHSSKSKFEEDNQMISNFGFQSVYLFSKDYIDLAKRVEKTLPIWNSFNSLELLSKIEVERHFDVKFRNELFRFKEGDCFQKVHVYRRRLEPWPEELALSKVIFQEEVPGVHFIPGEMLVDYFISGFISELEIVLEKDFDTLNPVEVHLNSSGQANRLLIIK